MNIIITDLISARVIKNAKFIPRIGDRVDFGYTPYAKISDVICFPNRDLIIKTLGTCNDNFDAILFCEGKENNI